VTEEMNFFADFIHFNLNSHIQQVATLLKITQYPNNNIINNYAYNLPSPPNMLVSVDAGLTDQKQSLSHLLCS
jgi:hypothetical protein